MAATSATTVPNTPGWYVTCCWSSMLINLLLLMVPLSLVLAYLTPVSPLWVFVTASVAIVPLAEWIRRATDQLARRAGPSVGGLVNVTFGNAAEMILALFVLAAGHTGVVKGQITGSIIGNGLLGLGLAVLIGTWGREKLTFHRERAGLLSSLLILALIALLVPALFDYTERQVYALPNPLPVEERLSLGVAAVLIFLYAANLVYTMVTRRDVFSNAKEDRQPEWGLWRSLGVLAVATAVIAWESELISKALEATAETLGLTSFFLGVIVLAVVGNVSEYLAAVYFARQDQMTVAMSITIGSTLQIALLVAPLLVLISYFLRTPMNLVFANPLELIAIAAVAFVVSMIARDGETNWYEGVMLLSVYAILGLAFFFVTP